MAQEDNHFLIIIILSPAVASVWLALLALHFLPTCIAVVRKTSSRKKVFMMNLFLGWTFLGWIVALVWSFG
ncbi:MAG: superinfection immunity protein [Chloroflexota bacterium]|nr:superinfection immunity protein [Chloroflexota bacterium]